MLREIYQGNQRGDQEEPIAKAARELWQASSKMVRSVEWSEDDRVLQFRGKIYVPCKGNWGTGLQENPQLILQLVVMIQLTSRRILRD